MSLDPRKSEPGVHLVNHCVFMMIPFKTENSLEAQWLGLCAFTTKGPGSILCWRTKIPKPQDSANISSVQLLPPPVPPPPAPHRPKPAGGLGSLLGGNLFGGELFANADMSTIMMLFLILRSEQSDPLLMLALLYILM